MHLGSIYLVVNDFEKSIGFYENLLEIPVTFRNMDRFAEFEFEGHCISLLNAHFDAENPEKIVTKGVDTDSSDNLRATALAPNTHKFALNFWTEDLRTEYERIKELDMTEKLSKITYICCVAPYYSFQLSDPDGNVIEVNGSYTPKEGEFDK